MIIKDVSGIYVIENLNNHKVYIGSSKNINQRWAIHIRDLNHFRHPNIHLQRAWNLYGAKCFIFRILLICSPGNLIFFEQRAIDKLDAFKGGYNRRPKAESCLGIKRSEETKQKISLSKRGFKMSEEWCRQNSERMKGNTNSRGKKMSTSYLEKLSQRMRGNKHLLGVKMSDVNRQKLRERMKGNLFGLGRIPSKETLLKMSIAQTKRWGKYRILKQDRMSI